jgi:predicted enzyme involved in methoxymalonyl-ACP biosynthesis
LDELKRIMLDGSLETYVLRCSDRFGTYGIVGFALVDVRELRLIDLMFSCRVQSKRVEHGFLAWLLKRHEDRGGVFHANLRKTPKNAPGSAVFPEMGFVELGTNESGVTTLARALDGNVPDDQIIEFVAEESQSASYA